MSGFIVVSVPSSKYVDFLLFGKYHLHEGLFGVILAIGAVFLFWLRLYLMLFEIFWNQLNFVLAFVNIMLFAFIFVGGFLLVRDFDENISLSISHYLSAKNNSNINSEVIHKALMELKYFLCENKIIVRNLRPYNLLYKRVDRQGGRIVIIDNIGHHNNRFHLTDHVGFLAKRNLLKKWQNLIDDHLNHDV